MNSLGRYTKRSSSAKKKPDSKLPNVLLRLDKKKNKNKKKKE